MIIESIRIDNFGRLRDVSYTFGEGLTIIEGDNESGKSTLAAFIRYMLYGFGRAAGSDLAEKKKRMDWQSGRAAGSMTVRVGTRRYRIERVTTVSTGAREREVYHDTYAIVDAETSTPQRIDVCPGEYFLGVPETVFLQTAFIGQIGSHRPDGSKLSAAIENLLFAGDEETDLPRAMARLEELRRTLHHKRGTGGALQELESKEAALASRLESAREQNAALLATEGELAAVKEQQTEAEEEARRAKAAEALAANLTLVRTYDRLHAAEETLATAEAALIGMDGLPSHRLTERDLTDLAVARRASEDAARRLAAAEAELEARRAERIDAQTEALLRRAEGEGGIDAIAAYAARLSSRVRLSLLACLLCGLPGLVLLFVFPLLSLLLVGSAIGLWQLLAARRERQDLCRAYGVETHGALLERLSALRTALAEEQAWQAAVAAAEERKRTVALEHRRAAGELDTVVRRFDTRLPEGEVDAFLDDLASTVRAVLEKKKAREQERAAAAAAVETLRAGLRGTSEAAARAALPADGELPQEEDLHAEEWHQRAVQADARCRILSAKERELENKLLSTRSRIEDPAVLEAALQTIREKKEAENARYAAVLLACEALGGAGERLRAEISPRLSARARELLAAMTGGRYDSVGVDHDLSMTVGTESGTRSPEWLSTGTQDLVYLSLRLALVDLLYREKPPVCFDESLAHQDDGRLARVVSTLAACAGEGQQCLLFTCHGREREAVQAAAGEATFIRLS